METLSLTVRFLWQSRYEVHCRDFSELLSPKWARESAITEFGALFSVVARPMEPLRVRRDRDETARREAAEQVEAFTRDIAS